MAATVLPLARLGVHILAGLGVTKVVGDIVTRNAVTLTTLDAVRTKVGQLVLTSLISHETSKHVDNRIDAALAWYENRNAAETDLKVEK